MIEKTDRGHWRQDASGIMSTGIPFDHVMYTEERVRKCWANIERLLGVQVNVDWENVMASVRDAEYHRIPFNVILKGMFVVIGAESEKGRYDYYENPVAQLYQEGLRAKDYSGASVIKWYVMAALMDADN